MRLITQLYIEKDDPFVIGTQYDRLDLFDFETIELESTIQDARDIATVFTDFSRQFVVPASKRNNNIFKHYYNNSIDNGFDARVKKKAYISLNGFRFRDGYLRLTDVDIRNGKAYSYKLTFIGSFSLVKDIIGDDKLSTLSSLSIYDHDYNITKVYEGFTTGLGLSGSEMVESVNRDIVYPSIGARDKWFYDTSGATAPQEFNQGFSVNLYDPSLNGDYGINYLNLKPAIKVVNIIKAISDRYESINFDDTYLTIPALQELYMLLHNVRGFLSPANSPEELVSNTYYLFSYTGVSSFEYLSGAGDVRPPITRWEYVSGGKFDIQQYQVIATVDVVSPPSDSNYSIEILDGTESLVKQSNLSGTQSVIATLCTPDEKSWDNIKVVVSSRKTSELSNFNVSLELKQRRFRLRPNDYNDPCFASVPTEEVSSFYQVPNEQTNITNIEIIQHIPDTKIIDFLKGLFNMANLTAYINDDTGEIVIRPLIDYYNEGKEIDITRLVDNSEMTVSRREMYSNISFKYEDPKTFGIINKNEVSQVDYGNLEYQSSEDGRLGNLVFDGGKYNIKLPFEKMYYERLSDENDTLTSTDLTPMSNGWLVGENQDPILTKPILFYNVPTSVDTVDYKLGFKGKNGFDSYNRASNTNINETSSTNFGIEYDEYSGNEITNSLFYLYYSRYVQALFSPVAREYSLDIQADLDFLLSYELNDTLVIQGKRFFIESIDSDLNTGRSKLKLIDSFNSLIPDDPDNPNPPTDPKNVTFSSSTNDSITFTWTESTDDVAVTGYKIYLDSQFLIEIPPTTIYTISGLNQNTTYSIRVSAVNGAGLESGLSSDELMQTSNDADVTPPTAPTNLTVMSNIGTFVEFVWTPSTDNVFVSGYDIYVDGVLDSSSFGNNATIEFPSSSVNTNYEVYVKAFDSAGNVSNQSNTVIVTIFGNIPV
ncbi:MAG: fibronectin type III domain-containing protein [Pseudoalteromonas sp.]|uniref:fibronectin type III domain-containing protein n=1 Tax=Pseudoalteromonas sp. TaxID=53249 RepID=UPI001E122262|nr:fibronectin type III domain-containing protein [Pseudoalteromonas sp.]NRA78752.1 fibronectin type III domain-containing protein [Pseudoalteromonas sp.]